MLLSLTSVQERQFSRDLGSYEPRFSPWIIEFDASLSGIGLLWYYRECSGTTEVLLGGCSLDITFLGFNGDPAYQNTAEFIAATMGVRGLAAFSGVSNASVEFRGDSVSALTWAFKRGVRSELASNASVVFALQCMELGIEISGTSHLSSEENWRTDMLSRGSCMADVGKLDSRFANGAVPSVCLDAGRALQLCDPALDTSSSEKRFLDFWVEVRKSTRDPITLRT